MSVNSIGSQDYTDQWKEIQERIKSRAESNSIFNTYDDGNDDGHIKFTAGAQCVAIGAKDKLSEQIDSIVKDIKSNPLKAAGVIGAGLLLTAGTAAIASVSAGLAMGVGCVLGAIGVGFGAFQLGKAVINGIKEGNKLSESTSDKETMGILRNIGGYSTEGIEGIAEMALGSNAIANGVKAYAGTKVVDIINPASTAVSDAQANVLSPFLSKKQIELATNILNDTNDGKAMLYRLTYHEGSQLNALVEQATAITMADVAALGIAETLTLEDDIVDLIDKK